MITGGTIRKERLILSAKSPFDANTVKGGLAGQNSFLSTAPYGNKVDLTIEGPNISLVKHSHLPFTYEEVRTIIKKIQAFERIAKKTADAILSDAREALNSKLTLFYPNTQDPSAEFAFSYNWASIELDSPDFQKIYEEIRKVVTQNQGSSIKVFSNNTDIISIHNYSMKGLYLNRKSFDGIANIFVKYGMLAEEEKNKFVMRAAAFGVRSVVYMDARQLSTTKTDETFDMESDESYTPRVGAKHFLKPLVEAISKISRQGVLSTLQPDQLKLLYLVAEKPETTDKYSLAETIKECITAFASDFSEEIINAYREAPAAN